MIIKKIFSVAILYVLVNGLNVLGMDPSERLESGLFDGRVKAIAIQSGNDVLQSTKVKGIVLVTDDDNEEKISGYLRKNQKDAEFKFTTQRTTDKLGDLFLKGEKISSFDATSLDDDFTTWQIYFYCDNKISPFAKYETKDQGQIVFLPNKEFREKETLSSYLILVADSVKEFLKDRQRNLTFLEWIKKPGSQQLLKNNTNFMKIWGKSKASSSSSEDSSTDDNHQKDSSHETQKHIAHPDVPRKEAEMVITNTNAQVQSKYFGTWQRSLSASEYSLKATLSTEVVYKTVKDPFKCKQVILYRGDELWINIGLANQTYAKHFLSKPMAGRYLSKEDCQILQKTWSAQQLSNEETIYINCTCQYTHLDNCRQLESSQFQLYLTISPEVRRAIESKAQEGEVVLVSQAKIVQPQTTIVQPQSITDQQVLQTVKTHNTLPRASHFSANRIFFGGLTCGISLCAILFCILSYKGMLAYNFA